MPRDQHRTVFANGESDPSVLKVGRRFAGNWLFVSSQRRALSYVYEVYERDTATGFASAAPSYVGVTDCFATRWTAHVSNSRWPALLDLSCVIISGYASRPEARTVEAHLIDRHRPVYNTKSERKYLRIARASGVPREVFTAELLPTGWERGNG